MKIHRIQAILLRFLYYYRKSYERLSDAFYWPTIDLILWGLTSTYFSKYAPETEPIIVIVVSGLVFWLFVWRGQYEISFNVLEEIWNKNLINIFISPLKFSEWTIAFLILGIFKASLSVAFASVVAYVLYKVNIFLYGAYIIPFMILLLMTAWWIGFFTSGIILRYGTKVQTLAWSLPMIISPFSAIYYPINTLPSWAQQIAIFTPTSYVFEGIREIIATGIISWDKVAFSLVLNIIFLIVSYIFFRKSFNKVLEKGLIRIY